MITRHTALLTFEREGYTFVADDRSMNASIVDLKVGSHISIIIKYQGNKYGFNLETREEVEAMRDLCNELLAPAEARFEELREELIKQYQA